MNSLFLTSAPLFTLPCVPEPTHDLEWIPNEADFGAPNRESTPPCPSPFQIKDPLAILPAEDSRITPLPNFMEITLVGSFTEPTQSIGIWKEEGITPARHSPFSLALPSNMPTFPFIPSNEELQGEDLCRNLASAWKEAPYNTYTQLKIIRKQDLFAVQVKKFFSTLLKNPSPNLKELITKILQAVKQFYQRTPYPIDTPPSKLSVDIKFINHPKIKREPLDPASDPLNLGLYWGYPPGVGLMSHKKQSLSLFLKWLKDIETTIRRLCGKPYATGLSIWSETHRKYFNLKR